MSKELINTMVDTSAPQVYNAVSGNVTTMPDSYLLAVTENNSIKALTGQFYGGITGVYGFFCNHIRKEKLFLTAVDNLLKKNDFLQLTIQLDQELITDEEFQDELEKNEIKYLITMKDELDETDFRIATEILPKLNRFFTADEVSEMFSMPIENINKYLDSDLITANS